MVHILLDLKQQEQFYIKKFQIHLTTGIVTDIYVSKIPNQISVGSSIGIGTEKLLVLNKFEENNILRVKEVFHQVCTLLELN